MLLPSNNSLRKAGLLFALSFIIYFSGSSQSGFTLRDTALLRELVAKGEKCYLQQPDSALLIWQKTVWLINELLTTPDLDNTTKKHLKSQLAASYNGLGYIYRNQGNVPLAIDNNEKALKLREDIQDKNGIAESLNNIGVIYDYENDGDKALEYYARSLKVLEEMGEKYGMGTLFNNMAFVYSYQKNLDKAIEYYEKALTLQREINNQAGIGESYNNLGAMYRNKGEFEKALEYLNKGFEIRMKINDKRGIANSYKNLCDLFYRQKKYQPALEYGLKSLSLSRELAYPEIIMNVASELDLIYRATGDYKKALENYELFIAMRDSIGSEKNRKASIRTQLKHEFEKKAVADSIKVADQRKVFDARMKQEETQRFALYIIIGLTIVFALFMYNRFRITRKQKHLIEIKEKETSVQKLVIETKHNEITASINYAKRIQHSLLPQEKYIDKTLERMRDKKIK
jgi:tetratricopeptide (TPR) repeat protein